MTISVKAYLYQCMILVWVFGVALAIMASSPSILALNLFLITTMLGIEVLSTYHVFFFNWLNSPWIMDIL